MGSSPSLGKFFLSCLITFSTCTQGRSSEDGQVEGKTGRIYMYVCMYVCMSVCATCTPSKSSTSTDLIFPSFKTGNDLLKSNWKLPLEWDLSLMHNNWSLYNPRLTVIMSSKQWSCSLQFHTSYLLFVFGVPSSLGQPNKLHLLSS